MRPTLDGLSAAATADAAGGAAAKAYAGALSALGQHESALDWAIEATRRSPRDARCQLLRARLQFAFDEARNGSEPRTPEQILRHVPAFVRAWEMDPADAEACRAIGYLHLWAGQVNEAAHWLREAVQRAPADVANYLPLAHAYLAQPAESRRATDDVIGPFREFFDASVVFQLCGRGAYDEARELVARLSARDPDGCVALVASGYLAFVDRDIERALERHARAYRLHEGHPFAAFYYFFDLCTLERYDEARRVFRASKRALRALRPLNSGSATAYGKPEWEGEPLAGRTVLVLGGRAAGDTLQFARFAAPLAELGATVVVECDRSLVPLVGAATGVAQAVAPYDPCPEFDYEFQIDDSWLHLDLRPNEWAGLLPNFHVADRLRCRWREAIDGAGVLKVGVAWQGSPNVVENLYTSRQVPLAALEPLAQLPGVELYSLQVGPGHSQLAELQGRFRIRDLGASFGDFADTAAAILALDAVVSVDTSVAHLAGALCKPTLTLLPYVSSTARWPFLRPATPWYPTMQLEWQSTPGDWSGPIARAASCLARHVAARTMTA